MRYIFLCRYPSACALKSNLTFIPSNLVKASTFPLCTSIFPGHSWCQAASRWIIVRMERVLHCKWQFVRVLWGFRSPPFSLLLLSLFLFSSLPIISSSSSSCSSPGPIRAHDHYRRRYLAPPPSTPTVALEIFQEQRSALGTVRFAKRGKSCEVARPPALELHSFVSFLCM